MVELSITVYSHHFEVARITPRGRRVVEDFARRYIEYKRAPKRYDPMRRRYVESNKDVADCVFATSNADRTMYRFHINQMEEFKNHLKVFDLVHPDAIEWTEEPLYEPIGVDLLVKEGWIPKEKYKQADAIEFLEKPDPLAKLLAMHTGYGKAQPLDAKIKVPGGWITMGDVKVGTTVTAKDGTPAKVSAIHPQGEKDIYRITFRDGRSTECCAEHLWRIFQSARSRNPKWETVSTTEVIERLKRAPERCFVELLDSEAGGDVDLPIPAYTLGVLLGDAHLGVNAIKLSNPDQAIIDAIKEELPSDLTLAYRSNLTYDIVKTSGCSWKETGRVNRYLNLFKELALCGKLSHEKFVPPIYLHASHEQRLALLQGLLDTDGTAALGGSITFSSTSIDLAKAVQYLVRSIGGMASITPATKYFTYKGEKKIGRQAYCVNIRHRKPSELFRLKRKADRLNDDNQYAKTLKLRIEKIEYVGTKLAQCITIDHPDHLYVTDEFIVTHNSYTTMQAIANISTLSVWSVQAKFVEKTRLDMLRTYQIELEDMIVVRDTKDLKLLLLKAAEGPIDCKVILISSKLIQIWISLYEKMGNAILGVGYSCAPQAFYPLLRAGIRVIDEVHMEFHFNFKQDLYTHVPRSISLSATMISDSRFRNEMYRLTYPLSCRFEVPYIPFISATSIEYQFERPDRIRVLGKQGMYSHYVFEESVMKDKKVLANYVKMIMFITENEYVSDHREDETMLVYAAGVEFCTYLVEQFQKAWPDIRIKRYCGSVNDPYDNLLTAQIVVTTLGSAGTNVDIPKLKCAFLTTSVDSTQSNIQGSGRLRDDKLEPGRVPRFVWLYCGQIGRQVAYNDKKLGLLRPRALKLNEQTYSQLV